MAITPWTTYTSVARTVSNGVDLTTALSNTFTGAVGAEQNSFNNNGQTLLRVKNASGAPVTVTVFFGGTNAPAVDGMALGTDKGRTYSVGATTGDRLIGPFPVVSYGSVVVVGVSAATSVTVGILQPS